MEDFVEIRKYIMTIWRWWWLVILFTVIAAALGYFISEQEEQVYEATTTIIVGQSIQATELNNSDFSISEQLARTYADIARRQPVLQGVINNLGLDLSAQSLRGRVNVSPIEETQLLQISVEAGSLEEAQLIADEVARQLILLSPTSLENQQASENQQFIRQRLTSLQTKIEAGQARLEELETSMTGSLAADQVQELQSEINSLESLIADWENNYTQLLVFVEGERSANYLAVIEPAQGSSTPIRPRTRLNTIIAGMLGFALSLGLIFLIEFLDDRLKSSDDLHQTLGLTVLGSISRIRGKHYQDKLITMHDMFSPITESYRMIRSNVQFASVDRSTKTVMITSAAPGEGKSTTIANLGVVMAQAGLKTVIVDADLRRPTQHEIFQVVNLNGLTDFLFAPEEDVKSFLKKTNLENLYVLPTGVLPPNPAELMGSQRMEQILAKLQEAVDMVLIDTPPSAIVTDGPVLSTKVDGVVLVVQANQTRLGVAKQALFNLQRANANILGGVLNQASTKGGGYYYQTYYTPIRAEADALQPARRPATSQQRRQLNPFFFLPIPKLSLGMGKKTWSGEVVREQTITKLRPQMITWPTMGLRRLGLIPLVAIILGLWQIPWMPLFHQQVGLQAFLQATLRNKSWPTAPNWFDVAPVEAAPLTSVVLNLEQIDTQPVAVRTLGLVSLVTGDLTKGQQILTHYAEQAPDDSLAQFFLGESYRRQGEISATVEHWEKIGARMPLQYLSIGLIEQEIDLEALNVLEAIMRLDPTDVSSRIRAAQIWREQGDPLQALALAQDIINLAPESISGYSESGYALSELEQHEASINFYNQALQFNPKNAYNLLLLLGKAHTTLGQWSEAIDIYRQAIDKDPTRQQGYEQLGQLYCELDQPEEAQNIYEQAIEGGNQSQGIEKNLDHILQTGNCP